MPILKKGLVHVRNKQPDLSELQREIRRMKDGEYAFYILDKTPNNALPRLKYLYGVVLRSISEELPDHPPEDVLYRKFEKMYAPSIKTKVFKSEFIYQDLKRCTADELELVIQKIIWFASENLNMKIFKRMDLKNPFLTEAYIEAYNDQWKDYSRTI